MDYYWYPSFSLEPRLSVLSDRSTGREFHTQTVAVDLLYLVYDILFVIYLILAEIMKKYWRVGVGCPV